MAEKIRIPKKLSSLALIYFDIFDIVAFCYFDPNLINAWIVSNKGCVIWYFNWVFRPRKMIASEHWRLYNCLYELDLELIIWQTHGKPSKFAASDEKDDKIS